MINQFPFLQTNTDIYILRKTMRYLLLILIIPCFASFAPPSETQVHKLHYAILQDGKRIGEIKASRTLQDNQIFYDVATQMTVKIVMKQDIKYNSYVSYQNGILNKSVSKSYLNGKLHSTCNTLWKGNKYEIRKDKDASSLSRQITYSGVMLYFKEPHSVSLIYSEMNGVDNRINKVSDHQYLLTDSKSKKVNRYWYKNGILDHAYINHTLMDIEVQRIN